MALWHENLTPYNNARNNVIDQRFAQSTYVGAPKVTRGRIENIRVSSSGSAVADKKHVFHFLTNPSEIDLGYNVNTSIDYTDPANEFFMSDPVMTDGLLSVTFQMMLDRTYEVWSGTLPEGVLHDIAQLEKVLGMPDLLPRANSTDRVPSARMDSAPAVNASMFPGVIVKRPIRILFGSRNAFSFDGFIQSLSITLMKFNRHMVPVRAGINVTATSWGNKSGDSSPLPTSSTGKAPAMGSLPQSAINVLAGAVQAEYDKLPAWLP